MKITFMCSDATHPVNSYIESWISSNESQHQITMARKKADLVGGDLLFLISCSEIVSVSSRKMYAACLVLHASPLPIGRGWSPHIWGILGGSEEITLSMLEAEDVVDSGRIWKQLTFEVPKHALWDEINHKLFQSEIEMIDFAINQFPSVVPNDQSSEVEATYYRRRTPEDSRIDPDLSIASQFDRIRVCDPHRYPAFFELHGHRYKLILEKLTNA